MFQVIQGITNSNAQSAADIEREVRSLEMEGNDLIQHLQIEDQRRISALSCQNLISEARQLTRNGDYWAAQGTRQGNAYAYGNYTASEQRYQEYNRRCR